MNMRAFFTLCFLQGAVLAVLLTSGSAEEFSHHEVVRPVLIHSREKRHLNSTRIKNETRSDLKSNYHVNDFAVKINISGKHVVLDLKLNRELIAREYFVRHQGESPQILRPSAEEIDLCEYIGIIRGRPDSRAAISTCDGLSGLIFDGKEMHYIEPKLKNGGPNDEHFLYRQSSLQTNDTCGFYNNLPEAKHKDQDMPIERLKRNIHNTTSSNDVVGVANNSPNSETRYVELVFVVDNHLFKKHGTIDAVSKHCQKIANIVNLMYSSLNIFITLVGVVVWTERNEIDIKCNATETLNKFNEYRKKKLVKEHPNDYAQLLTEMQFEGKVLGAASQESMCSPSYSGGVVSHHKSGLVAGSVAHEMGHTFGMKHDTRDCKCPTERCIMSIFSELSRPFIHWSNCSSIYMAQTFQRGEYNCLGNKPNRLFELESPVCGNGVVEPGEQCDCGLPEQCDNPCCNASTCMLHLNATCATGKCCDLDTCEPKLAGTECRTADHECDLPELCNGQSISCPNDLFKLDGEQCNGGKDFCYNGACKSHNDQCKLLWGKTVMNSEHKCYEVLKVQGSRNGSCGYDQVNKVFVECDAEDDICGMLQCKQLDMKQEFFWKSVPGVKEIILYHRGKTMACIIDDLFLKGFVPDVKNDGEKCGNEKICVNKKCIAVATCKEGCSSHGICNHEGLCYCDVQHTPPDCIST